MRHVLDHTVGKHRRANIAGTLNIAIDVGDRQSSLVVSILRVALVPYVPSLVASRPVRTAERGEHSMAS